jgi:ABC-2 type transport system ATP-binding protein
MSVSNVALLDRPADRATALMEVAGLAKQYGEQRALADISFAVNAGEVLGLIGPNGAGKTTLMEAIAGVIPADGGRILWQGQPLGLPHRRDLLFYLPDGLRPWDDQYVFRVIAFFTSTYGRAESAVAEVVRMLGLAPVLRKRVHALSKGYSRRLMLALALLTPHPVLLMDEPFDGFDLRQTREIMGVLREVANNGRTLVLAIHQLIDAERVCDRFVLLVAGRIRGIGTLVELRAQTAMPSAGLEDVFLALS